MPNKPNNYNLRSAPTNANDEENSWSSEAEEEIEDIYLSDNELPVLQIPIQHNQVMAEVNLSTTLIQPPNFLAKVKARIGPINLLDGKISTNYQTNLHVMHHPFIKKGLPNYGTKG